jgi:two-component system, NtrC family, nitrogen regulation sensor histidine kinase NtrY
MTAQKRFIISFVGFQVVGSLLMAIVAARFLSTTLQRILSVSGNPFLLVMQHRMIVKSVITFSVIAFVITVCAIPAGIILSRLLTAPYLRVLKRFSTLARNRLPAVEPAGIDINERLLLERYASTLLTDMQTLKDYEKARSWKEGARMLMHELKNPLTPLKLSVQQLILSAPREASSDAANVLSSVNDIEKILGMFKNLVNVEFGAKSCVNLWDTIDGILLSLRNTGLIFCTRQEGSRSELFGQLESTLVRMLVVNLINNSVEENPTGCEVLLQEAGPCIRLEVLTRDRTIAEPAQVFKAGYSSKGDNRGFGLFLSRLISEYLDLDLSCANTSSGAIFSLSFKTCAPPIKERVCP